MKGFPFTNVTNTQYGDHLACSAKASSFTTQSRSPTPQWKHVTLSKLPVMTKCLMRVKKCFRQSDRWKEVWFVQRYTHVLTSIKEARLCQRFGRWYSLLMCPCVERFESRIKQVVGRVCRRCPMLCSPQLYVSFGVILQTACHPWVVECACLWAVVDRLSRRCLGLYHANVGCVRCRNRWRFPAYKGRCVPDANAVWLPCR